MSALRAFPRGVPHRPLQGRVLTEVPPRARTSVTTSLSHPVKCIVFINAFAQSLQVDIAHGSRFQVPCRRDQLCSSPTTCCIQLHMSWHSHVPGYMASLLHGRTETSCNRVHIIQERKQ